MHNAEDSSLENEFDNCMLGCSFGSPVNVIHYVQHLVQCPEISVSNRNSVSQHVKFMKELYPNVEEIQNMEVMHVDTRFSNCILGCSFSNTYSVIEYVDHLIECANENADEKNTLKAHLATIKDMYDDVPEIQNKFIN